MPCLRSVGSSSACVVRAHGDRHVATVVLGLAGRMMSRLGKKGAVQHGQRWRSTCSWPGRVIIMQRLWCDNEGEEDEQGWPGRKQ